MYPLPRYVYLADMMVLLRTATYIVDMLFVRSYTTLFLSFWAFYFYSTRVIFLAHINLICFV